MFGFIYKQTTKMQNKGSFLATQVCFFCSQTINYIL